MDVQTFEDPARTIRVAPGAYFAVRLPGNPTTGYVWHAQVDDRFLESVAQTFEPDNEVPGAAGHELCSYRALKRGRTEITFEYRRPWEDRVRDSRRFTVVIE